MPAFHFLEIHLNIILLVIQSCLLPLTFHHQKPICNFPLKNNSYMPFAIPFSLISSHVIPHILGSVVGITIGYGLDGPGIESGGVEISHTCQDRPWGPNILLYRGHRVFPGCKERPWRDAEPSPLLVPWS